MAVAIKPLRRRRRTTQRGKPMTKAQRWGKVVITMPTPEGAITSTSTWSQTEPVAEEVTELVEEELPEAEADDL